MENHRCYMLYTRIVFLIVFMGLLVFVQRGIAQNRKDCFEKEGAIRYDYELVGDRYTVQVVHRQSCHEPKWGGNLETLVDEMNFGNYRFRVLNPKTEEVIFLRGFSPMFWEWQTTAEAVYKTRVFSNSLYFPKPKSDVVLYIDRRDKDNRWQLLFTDTIQVNDPYIHVAGEQVYSVDTLLWSGNSSNCVDLVLLSEGYTYAEMGKFIADARRLTDSLFAAEPFNRYKNHFNVLAVKVPSLHSGTDIPLESRYRNTAFNSSFYTFGSERYLTTFDMKAIHNALSGIAFDCHYLLVNERKYGGGGLYNHLNICSSDNEQTPFVFIHEFGHGFAGLADEYYESSTAYEEFYPLGVEPWEPNLTTLTNFTSKWQNMLEKQVPVPTPRNLLYLETLGVFEGGGYQEKGIYSPMQSCWMKERAAGRFCPVCQHAISRVIEQYIQLAK